MANGNQSPIATLLQNKHMNVVVCALAALQVADLWFPQFQVQLDGTRKIVLMYALLVATNATPPQPTTPTVKP